VKLISLTHIVPCSPNAVQYTWPCNPMQFFPCMSNPFGIKAPVKTDSVIHNGFTKLISTVMEGKRPQRGIAQTVYNVVIGIAMFSLIAWQIYLQATSTCLVVSHLMSSTCWHHWRGNFPVCWRQSYLDTGSDHHHAACRVSCTGS